MRRDTDGVRSLVHRWQPEPLPLLWRGWLLSKCECSDTHQRDGCTETPPIRSPVPRTCRRRSRCRWERADAVDGLTLKERKPSRNRVQNPGPDFSQFTLQENKIQAGQNPTTYSPPRDKAFARNPSPSRASQQLQHGSTTGPRISQIHSQKAKKIKEPASSSAN